MEWRPKLTGPGPLYEQIAACLQRDIAAGVLKPGDCLPPQRILADALGLSVGTVTKSYQKAEMLGLLRGQIGRGTFITGTPGGSEEVAAASKTIDLSINTTRLDLAPGCLADALRRVQRRPDAAALLNYAPTAGMEAHRKAACCWLARAAHFASVEWSRLIITCGGQHAMALAFAALCVPGDTILCEAATYYGARALAETAGYKLHGVAMDGEGAVPAALDEAAQKTGARTVYLMPTVQVPTARTMTENRRRDILSVARKRKLHIVEDDNYPLFASPLAPALTPLAEMAPDLCFYIGGVSKMLSPGLRTGFLVVPTPQQFADVLRILRSTVYATSFFGPAIFAEWVENGSGWQIAAAMTEEMTARWKLAIGILNPDGDAAFPLAPHLWLEMSELDTARVAGRAQRAGLIVTPPDLPLVDPKLICGLRLCLGTPSTRADVIAAMTRLRDALGNRQTTSPSIFI